MLLGLGIFAIAFGWLLIYGGYKGIGIADELRHVFNPQTYKAPRPTNPN